MQREIEREDRERNRGKKRVRLILTTRRREMVGERWKIEGGIIGEGQRGRGREREREGGYRGGGCESMSHVKV
jgi:hypothetical protein